MDPFRVTHPILGNAGCGHTAETRTAMVDLAWLAKRAAPIAVHGHLNAVQSPMVCVCCIVVTIRGVFVPSTCSWEPWPTTVAIAMLRDGM